MTETETKAKKATEVKEPKTSEELMQEASLKREADRIECGEKIDVILKEYGCQLTAQMIIGEGGSIPRVFIIDARQP